MRTQRTQAKCKAGSVVQNRQFDAVFNKRLGGFDFSIELAYYRILRNPHFLGEKSMSQLGLDQEATVVRPANVNESISALAACPDCKRLISHRAVACPGCGVRLQRYPIQQPTVARIAGGVIVGYFGILIINAVLFFVALIFFAGAFATAFQGLQGNQPPATRSR